MARTLFVSDVHLRPREPSANRPFRRFLERDFERVSERRHHAADE